MFKRRFLDIPLGVLLTFLIPLAVVMGYGIVILVGTYKITEPVTVSPVSWTVGAPGALFYAGETSVKDVTLSNAASVPIEIDMVETITGPTPAELTVTFAKKITVPANDQIMTTVIVKASKSITPGEYTVSISVIR